ncbi:MAG: hypothetical protein ACLQU4_08830 [Limisphaerales bacterium]
MKSIPLTIALGAAIALMSGSTAQAGSATLSNIAGGAAPTPGPYDCYMLDNETYYSEAQADQEPASSATINYYSNGGGGGYFPGQIFTTPALPAGAYGFSLASVTVNEWGNDGGGLTTSYQDYTLTLLSVQANTPSAGEFTVTPIASYTSQPYEVSDEYYMTFVPAAGTAAALTANTEYCWTVGNDGSGWVETGAEPTLGNTGGTASALVPSTGLSSEYNASGYLIDPNDMAVVAPVAGGVIYADDQAPTFQAMYDLQLTPITFAANPVTIATAGNIYQTPEPAFSNGTAVTLDCGSILGGVSPFNYQWQVSYTAPGANTAGSFANTGGNSSSLTVTPAANGYYQYQVIVTDSTTPTPQTAMAASVGLVIAPAALTVNMADEGASYSPPGCYDAIQQTVGGGMISSINYYDNFTASPAGNIFFTGNDASGYTLTSIQIETGNNGDTSSSTTLLQPYYLCIYQLNTAQTLATLVQQYYCPSFLFTFGDWIEWQGLSTPLAANSTYAYTFVNDDNASWAGLDASPTPVATSPSGIEGGVGVAVLISPEDRNVSQDTAGCSGTFIVGLTDGGVTVNCPQANGLVVSPLGTVAAGTTVSLSETPGGEAPFTYTWKWDAGLGGTPSVIVPGTTAHQSGSSIDINTVASPLAPGTYQFTVTVDNGHELDGSSTSPVASVTVLEALGSCLVTDLGSTNTPAVLPNSSLDIYDLVDNCGDDNNVPPGLGGYYINNTPPGQSFLTGSYPLSLTSLYVKLGGLSGSGGLPVTGQPYAINIYTISGTNALPYASYTSGTTVIPGYVNSYTTVNADWLEINGFAPLPLQANTTYAWTFSETLSGDSGWMEIATDNTGTNLLGSTTGSAVSVPFGGGGLNIPTSGSYDAVFDAVLLPVLNYTQNANGSMTLTWAAGTLVSTTSLSSPAWTPVGGASSPYTFTPPATGSKFYAVVVP